MKKKYTLFSAALLSVLLGLTGCTKNYAHTKARPIAYGSYAYQGNVYGNYTTRAYPYARPHLKMPRLKQPAVAPKSNQSVMISSYTSKPRLMSTMKPYWMGFRRYSPLAVGLGTTMNGVSSWYGPNFHGKETSSGERYNMHALTAAHKTWPMDTMVRVDNLTNGKSVVVRINDRGPFVRGRVVDCSYAAGKAIGLDKSGVAKVRLTVVGFAGRVSAVGGKKR